MEIRKGNLKMSELTGLRDGVRRATLEERLEIIVKNYFAGLQAIPRNEWPDDLHIARDILSDMQTHIQQANNGAGKGEIRDKMVHCIPPAFIADALLYTHRFVNINFLGSLNDRENSVLAVYMEEGYRMGTYTVDDIYIRSIITRYNRNISRSDYKNVLADLQQMAPVVLPCTDPNLIALDNGIYNDTTKQLMPFTPDLVFPYKLAIGFNPNAEDVCIQEPDGSIWSVDSWFQSINSDPENVRFLWNVLAMVVRPNRCWGKAVFLYSDKGNNGKGTYCRLIRNILGEDNQISLSIPDFDKQFSLENLVSKQAIIADENPVGIFVDDTSGFKAAITGDSMRVERKYKSSITMKFRGLVIQCINGFPKFKDQSNSILRRIAMVKMDQNFEGCEKKYIKQDYIGRKAVLEYIVKKLMLMTVSEEDMDIPSASSVLVHEYREFNDPVFEFWNEFREEFVWDLLPFTFLYDLFKRWFDKMHPSGKMMSYKQFVQNLRASVESESTGEWTVPDVSVRSSGRMNKPERLIVDYDLTDWMNLTYAGNDWRIKAGFHMKISYRGLQRIL